MVSIVYKTLFSICIIFLCLPISNEDFTFNHYNSFVLSSLYDNSISSNFTLTTSLFEQYEDIYDALVDLAQYLISKILLKTESSLNETCYNELNKTINGTNDNLTFFVQKIVDDSSKNRNDLSSYRDCMTRKMNYNVSGTNTTYLLVEVGSVKTDFSKYYDSKTNSTTSFDNGSGQFMFGICIPQVCNEYDFATIVNTSYFIFSDALDQNQTLKAPNFDVIQMNYSDYNRTTLEYLGSVNYFKMIPLIIIIIHIFIVFFSITPFCIWKYCFKNKIDEKNKEDKSKGVLNDNNQNKTKEQGYTSIYNKKAFNYFKESLKLSNNFDELFNYKVTSDLNNDSGFTYIRGVKGISMIFFIFGDAFFILFNSPVSVYGKYNFMFFMKNFFFFIFSIGIRYAPRVLLSCSGYFLFYKLMNYLDEANEDAQQNKKEEEDTSFTEDENSRDDSISNGNISYESLKQKKKEKHIVKCNIPYKVLGKFYLYQIHKYLIYILLICFIQFSLYDFIKWIVGYNNTGPFWEIFKQKILFSKKNKNTAKLYKFFLGLISSYSFTIKDQDSKIFLNYFWLVENEILFFVITSFLIFIGYKYKRNINKLFFFIIISTFIMRYVLYVSSLCISQPPSIIDDFKRTSWYYYTYNYGSIMTNPLNNYMYYLIGVFFGSLNYVIQKGITGAEGEKEDKPFITSAIAFVQWFKTTSKKRFMFLSALWLLSLYLFASYQVITINIKMLLKPSEQELPNYFREDLQYTFDGFYFIDKEIKGNGKYHGFFFLFDIDYSVLIINLLFFGLYLKGGNFINDFLSNSFWSLFNKLYYSFLIMINPTTLYILLQSESRINFNVYNCALYSFITFFFTFIISTLIYAFFEMPLKRMLKLIMNRKYFMEKFEEMEKENGSQELSSFSYRPLFSESDVNLKQ